MSKASVSIEEAQVRLRELISQLPPGGEVVIRDGDRPVARLVPGLAWCDRRMRCGRVSCRKWTRKRQWRRAQLNQTNRNSA
jgi:antitoxin (DNA-binding transcriptional repressor) of toxin-antitoxin stability system